MARLALEDLVKKMGDEPPKLPMVASQLLALFKDSQAGTADIKRVLAYDPEFSARVVQVAKAAAERSKREVTDLNMAVNYLGFESLKSIVILVGLMQALPERKGAIRFETERFWRHSLASGIAYRYLARRFKEDEDVCFLGGIFHDLGKLLLNLYVPRETEQILLMAERSDVYFQHVEALVIDSDHGEFGAWLCRYWGVSEEIVYFICHHHGSEQLGKGIFAVAALADYLLCELGMTSPGSFGDRALDSSSWPHFETKPSDIRQIKRELKAELKIINYIFPEPDFD